MLALERDRLEYIDVTHAGEKLEICIVSIKLGKVRLGFEGPRTFVVNRREVTKQIAAELLRSELTETGKGAAG